jgi:hypothetical protein
VGEVRKIILRFHGRASAYILAFEKVIPTSGQFGLLLIIDGRFLLDKMLALYERGWT